MDQNQPVHRSAASYKYFLWVALAFVTVLLVSNTAAVKIIQLGPFFVSGAIIIFPISYIFGDILTEVYGYRESRKIIWAGFGAQIFMVLAFTAIQHLPGAPFWQNQSAFEAILGAVPRIVFGSIIAYFVGEFANSYVLSRMKVKMVGRHLWMRTIGSTIVGEGVDSVIFALIAFGGLVPWSAMITMILSGYVLKVTYEVVVTPLTYKIVHALKRAEGVDVYDRGINYNPFLVEV